MDVSALFARPADELGDLLIGETSRFGCLAVEESLDADVVSGPCNVACPVANCAGRCDHASGHGGKHECGANASHPEW